MNTIEKIKREPLLTKNNRLVVPELCDYLNVSPAMIRNDLRDLENSGLIKRILRKTLNFG